MIWRRPRKKLYGSCLHSYTIKEAIHDGAVLGFNVENLGPKGIVEEDEEKYYHSEGHMRNVLKVVLNQSLAKVGIRNRWCVTVWCVYFFQNDVSGSDIATDKNFYAIL